MPPASPLKADVVPPGVLQLYEYGDTPPDTLTETNPLLLLAQVGFVFANGAVNATAAVIVQLPSVVHKFPSVTETE